MCTSTTESREGIPLLRSCELSDAEQENASQSKEVLPGAAGAGGAQISFLSYQRVTLCCSQLKCRACPWAFSLLTFAVVALLKNYYFFFFFEHCKVSLYSASCCSFWLLISQGSDKVNHHTSVFWTVTVCESPTWQLIVPCPDWATWWLLILPSHFPYLFLNWLLPVTSNTHCLFGMTCGNTFPKHLQEKKNQQYF